MSVALGREPSAGFGESVGAVGINVQGVERSFGAVRALDGLDLVAHPGEVTALVGPNGSGKTTLLLMLATLLTPDAGELRVGGLDPVTHPRDVRRVMGWMPDGFGSWDALSVREVLLTVAAAYRLAAASRPKLVAELMHTMHLDDLADRPARVLSRGQKQRLGVARALIHSPSVLLLDEPASGLDPRSRIELRDVLRALAAQGTTVLVSSHILAELEEMSDRAVLCPQARQSPLKTCGQGRVHRPGGGSARSTRPRYEPRFTGVTWSTPRSAIPRATGRREAPSRFNWPMSSPPHNCWIRWSGTVLRSSDSRRGRAVWRRRTLRRRRSGDEAAAHGARRCSGRCGQARTGA